MKNPIFSLLASMPAWHLARFQAFAERIIDFQKAQAQMAALLGSNKKARDLYLFVPGAAHRQEKTQPEICNELHTLAAFGASYDDLMYYVTEFTETPLGE